MLWSVVSVPCKSKTVQPLMNENGNDAKQRPLVFDMFDNL